MEFADVVFDYEGALAVAKRLCAFADQLETMMAGRESAETDAQVEFRGPYSTQLTDRIDTERLDVTSAAGQLRMAATEWATAWKDAVDEQNRVRYARAYEYSKENQGLFGKLDGIERPPDPVPVGVPQPPSFTATGGLQDFGKMV